MVNADGSNYHRLTTDDSIRYTDPRIDPQGHYLTYSAFIAGNFQLFKMDLDIPDAVQQLAFDYGDSTAPSISPDGKVIAYTFTQSDHKSVRILDQQTLKSWQIYGQLLEMVGIQSGLLTTAHHVPCPNRQLYSAPSNE